jgi:hypothetical protein
MSKTSFANAAVLPVAPTADAKTAGAVQPVQVRYETVAIDGVDVFYRSS